MFRSTELRTGIDLGSGSVKLVHGRGKDKLEEVTHMGSQPWIGDPDPENELCDEGRASEALRVLLDRLGLNQRSLGRVVVAIDGVEASLREIVMAPLSEKDLDRALPFEARTHLDVERMERPVLAAQILGKADALIEGGVAQIKVLLAAVPRRERNFPLRVLSKLDLEPEVIDLSSLAGLNELFTHIPESNNPEKAVGLLDLGRQKSSLHLSNLDGGILSRQVGRGAPSKDAGSGAILEFVEDLSRSVKESVYFYRSRHGKDVQGLYLAGGGAMLPGIALSLEKLLRIPVSPLNPLNDSMGGAKGIEEASQEGPRYVLAFGLCRWGEKVNV